MSNFLASATLSGLNLDRESGSNLSNVSHRRPKHLDRESMMLWLQHRQAAGLSVVWTDVCLENRDYALAIRREFGSWRNAIQAAGVQSGM